MPIRVLVYTSAALSSSNIVADQLAALPSGAPSGWPAGNPICAMIGNGNLAASRGFGSEPVPRQWEQVIGPE